MTKIFRNSMLMAAAILLGFTSCNNDEVVDNSTTTLTVKISAESTTKAIQAPGTATAATLNDGLIFLIAPDGSVYGSPIAINPSDVQGLGQVITNVVSSSRVFIVANPTPAASTALQAATSMTEIQAINESVFDYQSTLYTGVALSNISGVPANITVTNPTNATVNVGISPVIARLELAQITGGVYVERSGTPAVATGNQTRISGFDVLGIFVDSYYPTFTYTGSGSGTLVEQNQSTTVPGTTIGDWNGWSAGFQSSPALPAVNAGGSNVWAYNVASGNVARLIIAVNNVTYETSDDNGGTWTTGTTSNYGGTQFITVGGYTVGANSVVNFVRGTIYQISDLEFTTNNLHSTPNPTDLNLTVNVTIAPWVLSPTTPGLE
jgi:hypothetical protein